MTRPSRSPFDLSGKVILVSGANSGLGLGFADGLARAGADLIIWGRRAARNEAAARELRAHGTRVLAQDVDISDRARVATAADEAVATLGRLDGLIANAGISTHPRSFAELAIDEYHAVIDVNLHGTVYTIRECLRHMTARGETGDNGGSILVCGSLSVVAGIPRMEHYAAAKGALMAVTRSIAVEYGRYGIRANMILPGRIASRLGGGTSKDGERFALIPLAREGTPDDLAGVAVYLMSDASAYHTGDMVTVDGGLSVTLPGTKL